jgi:hypothetical protein
MNRKNTKKSIRILMLVFTLLLLAACSPQENQIPGTGEDQPTLATTAELSPGPAPDAVLNAQIWLNEQLGVPVGEIVILESEQEQWSDACLGLGQANEGCAQVITPGWRAVFDVNGQEYVVRTDETGENIRLETPAATPPAE